MKTNIKKQHKRVIEELKKCKSDDLEELAKIMMPRIIAVDQRTETSANHMAVMLLMDLQGKP
jgi:hypothetical protein